MNYVWYITCSKENTVLELKRNKQIFKMIGMQVRKVPQIKKGLIHCINFFLEYKMIFIGALRRNPAYFKHVFNSKIIAKPGTLSFKGGAFNPGALIIDENTILLLAKSQVMPWFKARGKNRKYFLVGNPVIFLLDLNSLKTVKEEIITDVSGFPENQDYAIEDLRLFYWKGKKMINHSYIFKEQVGEFLTQSSVASAISVLEDQNNKLCFYAIPKLDFPVQNIEKNWVYKESGSDLFLFYSINPFKVLQLEDEKTLEFRTVINKSLEWKLNNDGTSGNLISFSTNPIDFDEKYWVLIIHQFTVKSFGRCYDHWAVLINKETLLPEKITAKPIFTGMGARGRTPGIRYISSILKVENDILFFAGEGDVYVTVTKKPIKELESLFIDL